jgi:hypothetical protein
MPPRKRAADPATNGTHPAGPDRPVHAEYSDEPTCPKCLSQEISAEYHAPGTRPGPADTTVGPAPGMPEWLRRICECGFSWPEMCADYYDPWAQLIRDAVGATGAMPDFGLPPSARTSYLDASGTVVARWAHYNTAELEGVSRWENVTSVEVVIYQPGDAANPETVITVPSPWTAPAQPAAPAAAQ